MSWDIQVCPAVGFSPIENELSNLIISAGSGEHKEHIWNHHREVQFFQLTLAQHVGNLKFWDPRLEMISYQKKPWNICRKFGKSLPPPRKLYHIPPPLEKETLHKCLGRPWMLLASNPEEPLRFGKSGPWNPKSSWPKNCALEHLWLAWWPQMVMVIARESPPKKKYQC